MDSAVPKSIPKSLGRGSNGMPKPNPNPGPGGPPITPPIYVKNIQPTPSCTKVTFVATRPRKVLEEKELFSPDAILLVTSGMTVGEEEQTSMRGRYKEVCRKVIKKLSEQVEDPTGVAKLVGALGPQIYLLGWVVIEEDTTSEEAASMIKKVLAEITKQGARTILRGTVPRKIGQLTKRHLDLLTPGIDRYGLSRSGDNIDRECGEHSSGECSMLEEFDSDQASNCGTSRSGILD